MAGAAFPSWVYHETQGARLVNNRADFAALPGADWSYAPVVAPIADVAVVQQATTPLGPTVIQAQPIATVAGVLLVRGKKNTPKSKVVDPRDGGRTSSSDSGD